MIGNADCAVSGGESLNGGPRSSRHAECSPRLSLVRHAGRSTCAVGNALGLRETINRGCARSALVRASSTVWARAWWARLGRVKPRRRRGAIPLRALSRGRGRENPWQRQSSAPVVMAPVRRRRRLPGLSVEAAIAAQMLGFPQATAKPQDATGSGGGNCLQAGSHHNRAVFLEYDVHVPIRGERAPEGRSPLCTL